MPELIYIHQEVKTMRNPEISIDDETYHLHDIAQVTGLNSFLDPADGYQDASWFEVEFSDGSTMVVDKKDQTAETQDWLNILAYPD